MSDTARSPTAPDLHPVDAWWTVLVVDPVATRVLRLVTPWNWVTPMRLTLTAHLLGIVTAVLFAQGQLVAAAVLYEVRFVLDCVDGKLARRRGTTSAVGAYTDFVGDYLITAGNLVGLGLWLHWSADTPAVIALAPAVVFLAHMAVRLSTERSGEMRRISDTTMGRYTAWMAGHRLVPVPGRVDAEHGYLFVLPLVAVVVDSPTVLRYAAVVVSVYFGYVLLRFLQVGVALAAAQDREPPGVAS